MLVLRGSTVYFVSALAKTPQLFAVSRGKVIDEQNSSWPRFILLMGGQPTPNVPPSEIVV